MSAEQHATCAKDPEGESFSRAIAPFLAGFSLPAIASLAVSETPSEPWRDAVLACLIAATGFLFAGYQLSVGSLYTNHRESWGKIRATLSFFGLFLLITALTVLVAAVTNRWWVNLALVVFAAGGVVPILMRLREHYSSG